MTEQIKMNDSTLQEECGNDIEIGEGSFDLDDIDSLPSYYDENVVECKKTLTTEDIESDEETEVKKGLGINTNNIKGSFSGLPNSADIQPDTKSKSIFTKLSQNMTDDSADVELISFDDRDFGGSHFNNQLIDGENANINLITPNKVYRRMSELRVPVKLKQEYINANNPKVALKAMMEEALKTKFTKLELGLIIRNDHTMVDGKIAVESIGNLPEFRAATEDEPEQNGCARVNFDLNNILNIHDMLIQMECLLDDEELDGAVWFMSKKLYSLIVSVKDANHNYIQAQTKDGTRILRGRKVCCEDLFDSVENQIILANPAKGYIVIESSEFRNVKDEVSALPNIVNHVYKRFATGITNYKAWVAGRIGNYELLRDQARLANLLAGPRRNAERAPAVEPTAAR